MKAKALVLMGTMAMITLTALAAAGTTVSPGPPAARTMTFQKLVTPGNGFTINVTGMLTVNASAETVMGTITIKVTNATGAIVAMVTRTVNIVADGSGLAADVVDLPAADATLVTIIDPAAATVNVALANPHVSLRG